MRRRARVGMRDANAARQRTRSTVKDPNSAPARGHGRAELGSAGWLGGADGIVGRGPLVVIRL